MDNRFRLCLICFISIQLLTSNLETVAQSESAFSYQEISVYHKMGFLTYKGKLSSRADSDIISMPDFQFLSIGKVKELSTIANGCVLVKIKYGGDQSVVFEQPFRRSIEEIDYGIENQWSDTLVTKSICQLESEVKVKNRRYSGSYLLTNGVRVHLINIKERDVELFKYMISSLTIE